MAWKSLLLPLAVVTLVLQLECVLAAPSNVLTMTVEEVQLQENVGKTGSPVSLAFAKHFQNHMVLQREPQSANIYGFSPDIGTKIVLVVENSATGEKETYETNVKDGPTPSSGMWMFTLNPASAGTVVSITVMGESGQLSLSDVIFGDVWICSGQSNMEFTVSMMDKAKEELENAYKYPNIRIFAAAEKFSSTPVYNLEGILENWSKPSNVTLGGHAWTYFSAVCWLFGKNIHKELGVPIGLVDTNWGGTPVEAWSSPEALKKCNVKSTPVDSFTYKFEKLSNQDANSVLWNAMVIPFLPMTIYGSIWYQGEADASSPMVERYNCTFPTMIDDWRDKFHAASKGQTSKVFPFGFVQLSAFNPDPSITFGFPNIRWHQTADYGFVPNKRMPNVFMAVAMDLPDFSSVYGSIHPRDKTDVGLRLALSGLGVAYNKSDNYNGPFPESASISGSQLIVKYPGDDLDVRDWAGFELLCSSSSDGAGTWRPTSLIGHSTSTVALYLDVCAKGSSVEGLRYAWRESPCAFKKCAIYGAKNNLPGPPFVAYAHKGSNGKAVFNFGGPLKV